MFLYRFMCECCVCVCVCVGMCVWQCVCESFPLSVCFRLCVIVSV